MIILLISNIGASLYKFRKELIEKLIDGNNTVYVSFPSDEYIPELQQLGCEYIEINFARREKNIINDIKLIFGYKEIIKKIKPSIVLTYNIKPNIYGGMVCKFLNIPCIANITGLGTAVENAGIIQKITIWLYKFALKKSNCVFFQNEANFSFCIDKKIVNKNIKTQLVPGSGVNLCFHKLEEYPIDDEIISFVFIGRVMKDKGINELLNAADRIKKIYPNVEFNIIGGFDEDYSQLIQEYEDKSIIKYHGEQKDVREFIKNSHATIHPSYHEGLSNVLLESAAAGRPVLASNVAGCKETFDDGISGFGFEAKNAESLYETIIKFINLPHEQKVKMGKAGREKVEREFDRNIVVSKYMEEIREVTKT